MRTSSCVPFLVLLLLLPVAVGACDSGFESINTDPNTPTDVSPELLLPYALHSSMNNYIRPSTGMEFSNLVVQHWARISSTPPDRYIYGGGGFENFWNGFYRSSLKDFAEIEKLGREREHPNYEAIGLIMKSWGFSVLADAFGSVPYSEALKGEDGIQFPAFEPQQAVYDSLLANLERASRIIEVGGPAVSQDLIYDGDMAKWRKFSNSLQLRFLMRLSGRRDVGGAIRQLVANEPLLESTADNAELVYLAERPNQHPFADLPTGRQTQFRISETMVSTLQQIGDPRLPVYADTTTYVSVTKRAHDSLYVGTPNGQTEEQAAQLKSSHRSRIGRYFRQPQTPGVFMTHAEVAFLLAEAATRGFISGDAEASYREGIESSFSQYGVTAPDGYFSRPGVAFDPSTALQQIAEQKWIALYGQGFEAWSEWRRTGYPDLEPAIANANDDRIPERMRYPSTLQVTNSEHYQEAIDRQGPNDLNTRVWWDAEAND